jgi:uncharacterized protein
MVNRQIYISLAVKDVKKSKTFFTKLGFKFNKQLTGKDSACIIINKSTCVMLVAQNIFRTFTKKKVVNAKKHVEVGLNVLLSSRKEVDALHAKAIKAGGKTVGNPTDIPGMYARDFDDLDGHNWGLTFMDTKKMPKA